jgi:uncharacterized protein YggU (UPF0235/DUF167 family)
VRDWLRQRADGVEIAVRLTPKASANRVDSVVAIADGSRHLAVRVRAVPEKGKANAALEDLIAKWAGVARRGVKLAGGSTSRLKTVFMQGEPETLEQLLRRQAERGKETLPAGVRDHD